MIRINLLPVRAEKKKEEIRQQLSILVLSVIGTLVVFFAVYFYLLARIATVKGGIAQADQDLIRLKAQIGQIEDLKSVKAEVEKKLDIINYLRKEKIGPARRMATLSDADPEKLWLTKYVEKDGLVTINGLAVSEDLIAAFMKSLEATDDYQGVELVYTEQQEIAGVKCKKYELTCRLKQYKSQEVSKPDATKAAPKAPTAPPAPPAPPAKK